MIVILIFNKIQKINKILLINIDVNSHKSLIYINTIHLFLLYK